MLPGCEVVYRNEKDNIEQVWKYEGGLKEYLTEQLDRPPLVQPFEAQGFAGRTTIPFLRAKAPAGSFAGQMKVSWNVRAT